MFGDADLPVFFADFGVPVFFGSQGPVKGNLDRPGKDAMFGESTSVSDQEFCLELPYNAFSPFPASGNVLTVNGAQYKVRSTDPKSDGGVIEVKLRKLS